MLQQKKSQTLQVLLSLSGTLDSKSWSRHGYCMNRTEQDILLRWKCLEWSKHIPSFWEMSLCLATKLEWLPNQDVVLKKNMDFPVSQMQGENKWNDFIKTNSVKRGSVNDKHLFYCVCLIWKKNTWKVDQTWSVFVSCRVPKSCAENSD